MSANLGSAGATLPAPRGVRRSPVARPVTERAGLMGRLRRFEFSAFLSFFRRQSPSFWLVSMYLLAEYVRPQQVYPAIDILPWSEWTIIGCAGMLLIEGKLITKWDRADTSLFLFMCVVLLSSWFAVYPPTAWAQIKIPLSWALVYLLITRSVRTEEQYFVFFVLFMLFSLKMSQHASRSWMGAGMRYRTWGATGAPGWFNNSGEMAIQMAIFLPLSAYFATGLKPYLDGVTKRWKYWGLLLLPVSAILAVLASSSRGGQLGAAAVLVWMTFRSRNRWRGLVAGVVVGTAAWLVMPQEQVTRFTEMGDDQTSQSRLYYWGVGGEIMQDHPILGVGYENWMVYFMANHPPYHDGKGFEEPHNIFVEAGAELGLVGLTGFVMLIGFTFRMNYLTRKRVARIPHGRVMHYMSLGLDAAVIGYLVCGSFVTVLWYPYFWINYAMTAALYKVSAIELKGVRPPVSSIPGGRPVQRSRRLVAARPR